MNDAVKSEKTPELSSVHRPLGTHGLWGSKEDQLPAYIQNVAHALIRDGHDESSAIAMAVAAVKRWASGRGKVSPEVRAAASKAVGEWEALRAKHGDRGGAKKSLSLAAVPDLIKVGPEGYIHGFICVRPPCGGSGPGKLKHEHLTHHRDGGVSDKKSGWSVGHVKKLSNGRYEAAHADGHTSKHSTKEAALHSLRLYHNKNHASLHDGSTRKPPEKEKPKPSEMSSPAQPAKPVSAHPADRMVAAKDRKAAAAAMSDAELKEADKELSRRAALLGHPGKAASHHQAVKDEIEKRQGSKPPAKPSVIKPVPSKFTEEEESHLVGLWTGSYRGKGEADESIGEESFAKELHRLMTAGNLPDQCDDGCQKAHRFMSLVNSKSTPQPKLYRGIRLSDKDLAAFTAGKDIDLPAASFTRDIGVTEEFMDAGWNDDGKKPVLFQVAAGSKGMDIVPAQERHSDVRIRKMSREQETVSGGRYRVTGVKEQDGIIHVLLKQQDFSAH